MEIGVFINEKWVPGILTITDSALIIKMETNSLIITLLEIANINLQAGYINISYMERKNGEAKKKIISINSNNLNQIYDELIEKKTKPKEENNGEYVPPTNNIYTQNQKPEQTKTIASMYVMPNNQTSNMVPQQINTPEISDENKLKQEELNNKMKPKQKSYAYIFVILLIVVLIGFSIFMRVALLNVKANLYTEGSRMWTKDVSDGFNAYKIYEDGKCKYASSHGSNISVENCTYTLSGHKITFKFTGGIEKKYEWNIKYKLSFDSKIQFVHYLALDNEKYDDRVAKF
jgi:hypothetical protein